MLEITVPVLEMIKLSIQEVLFISQNHVANNGRLGFKQILVLPQRPISHLLPIPTIILGFLRVMLCFFMIHLYSLHSIPFFFSSSGSLKILPKEEALLTLQVKLVPPSLTSTAVCMYLWYNTYNIIFQLKWSSII